MSDSENQAIHNEEDVASDALTLLKQRADTMGIAYSHRIGEDALRRKINAKLDGQKDLTDENGEVKADVKAAGSNDPAAAEQAPRQLTKIEQDAQLRQKMVNEEMKLVRLRITCLNPNKRNWHGEILTVSNRFLGIVKKYIPFDEASADGYHVPYVIYKQLKARKFLDIKTFRDKQTGRTRITQKWVPEFAVEILPQLTKDDLGKLAAAQAAAGGVED